jgi:hypothetical protein
MTEKINKRRLRRNRISFLHLAELFLAVSLILVQQSCTKDEFTLPVRISLSFIITEQYKTNDTLSFESGEVVIKEIQFEGQREVGENYSFYTESGKEFGPQNFYRQSVSPETITFFDIPQGIYTLMKWKLVLSDGLERFNQDNDGNDDDGDDGDDNDDGLTPGLIIHGNYITTDGEPLQVRIEIDPFESFECQSINETGDKTINIISGNTYNAVLYFDPYFVFRAISSESLEDADYSDDEISPVLLISSDSNEELYEMILFRLQQSVKIVIS